MDEPLISHETLLLGLHDIRMPADAAGGVLAEVAVAIGLGLLLAVLLSSVFPLLGRRAGAERPRQLAEQVADLRDLPEEARAMALLHLARRHAPEALPEDRRTLYVAGAFPPAEDLEAALLRHGARDA